MAKDKELEAMEACHASLNGLEAEEQSRVLTWLADKLKVKAIPVLNNPAGGNKPAQTGDTSTPKGFMASKQPSTDIERVSCLAYYLTHYKETPHFKTRDLTNLNKDAHQPTLSNATVATTNAVNSRYLSAAGGGKRQITTIGEAVVEALPDREAVKSALANQKKAHRKRRKVSTKKAS